MEDNEQGSGALVCAGCGALISDRFYLLAAERRWHARCLRCSACQAELESEVTCFSKHGHIYCREDYYRRFALQRCARCHLGIPASEIVMRAGDLVYHLSCFTCVTCNKVLFTGDHYGMRDTAVYCQVHFQRMLQGHTDLHYSDMSPVEPNSKTAAHDEGAPVQRGRSRRRKNLDAADHVYNSDVSDMGVDLTERRFSCQKSKRMRTSFKHHQLKSMQTFFNHNHNPDAKDLKELAQKTGLTKRVLQVWFQNARAKFRRNHLYQESTGADISDNSSNTSPSVPSSEMSPPSFNPSSPSGTLEQDTHAEHNSMSPAHRTPSNYF